MALSSPVLLASVVFCLFAGLLSAAIVLHQERRYLELIDRLRRDAT